MKLETKRLILKNPGIKDAKDIVENANDYDVWYYTSSMPHPYKLKDAKEFIDECKKKGGKKNPKGYGFGIKLKSEKKLVGMISLFGVDYVHKKAGIGYWIGKKYRKLGIMSEAEKAVLDFAFKKLKLNKIKGEAMIENKGSNALFRKFGFRRIGIEREELIKKGKKKDAYVWELFKKNYKK